LERIQKDLEKVGIFYEDEREEKKHITLSFGVACTIPDAQQSMDIIREADKAMYSSIQLGGNRITISPVLNFSLGG
jgi:PleD family two-component response regulator